MERYQSSTLTVHRLFRVHPSTLQLVSHAGAIRKYLRDEGAIAKTRSSGRGRTGSDRTIRVLITGYWMFRVNEPFVPRVVPVYFNLTKVFNRLIEISTELFNKRCWRAW